MTVESRESRDESQAEVGRVTPCAPGTKTNGAQGTDAPYLTMLALVRDLSEHKLRRDPTFKPVKIYRVPRLLLREAFPARPILEDLLDPEAHGVAGIPKAPVSYE